MGEIARRTLSSRQPGSVAEARRWVEAICRGWAPGSQPAALLLVTSELVTNAITHGEGVVVIDLAYEKGRVRIEVTDQGDAPVIRTSTDDPDLTHGRGLQIVDALSRRWGTFRLLGSGNTVWADVRIRRRVGFIWDT